MNNEREGSIFATLTQIIIPDKTHTFAEQLRLRPEYLSGLRRIGTDILKYQSRDSSRNPTAPTSCFSSHAATPLKTLHGYKREIASSSVDTPPLRSGRISTSSIARKCWQPMSGSGLVRPSPCVSCGFSVAAWVPGGYWVLAMLLVRERLRDCLANGL